MKPNIQKQNMTLKIVVGLALMATLIASIVSVGFAQSANRCGEPLLAEFGTTSYWKRQLRKPKGETADQLACRLDVVNELSVIFSEKRTADTFSEARTILTSKRVDGSRNLARLDKKLLTVWLNVADGVIQLDYVVDVDGDGVADTTVEALLAEAELVRSNEHASNRELRTQINVVSATAYAVAAEPAPAAATLDCLDVITTADSVQLIIGTSANTPELDLVRMEMLFDTAQLSNPVIEMGAGFDSEFASVNQDELIVGIYGRSLALGAVNGELEVASITFDWTGENSSVSFVPGNADSETGSLSYLVGVATPFDGSTCEIAGEASEPPTSETASLTCLNVIKTADTIQLIIGTSANTPELDTVRMQMLFDTAQLSNPVIEMGADFDSEYGAGSQDNLVVGIYGRSLALGTGSGGLEVASVTFDWTGESTSVSLVPGGEAGAESGSLHYLVGAFSPFDGSTCEIPSEVTEPPTGESAYLTCLDMIGTEETLQIIVGTSPETPELDVVRMEMAFDPAYLTNPVVELGSDFDANFGSGVQDNIVAAVFGRSPSASGSQEVATITFEWAVPNEALALGAEVTFLEGNTATERGSLSYLIGEATPFGESLCMFHGEDGVPVP